MPRTFNKQPQETLDFDFDFDTWMPTGDSLPVDTANSTVTADSGITLGTRSHPGSNVVKQFISGGSAGMDYKVTCRITTLQSRIKEDDIEIRVREL